MGNISKIEDLKQVANFIKKHNRFMSFNDINISTFYGQIIFLCNLLDIDQVLYRFQMQQIQKLYQAKGSSELLQDKKDQDGRRCCKLCTKRVYFPLEHLIFRCKENKNRATNGVITIQSIIGLKEAIIKLSPLVKM